MLYYFGAFRKKRKKKKQWTMHHAADAALLFPNPSLAYAPLHDFFAFMRGTQNLQHGPGLYGCIFFGGQRQLTVI